MANQDKTSWLLLPCVLLALSGVSVLAPRYAAQAAPPAAQAASPAAPPDAPQAVPANPDAAHEDGDGDGDELLEHWGDPKYAQEERIQMAGMAGGFLLLGGLTWRRRLRRRGQNRSAEEPQVIEWKELWKKAA